MPVEVVRVVDVKTPGSGESHRNRWELLRALRPQDAVKFVLADESDYRWATEVIREHGSGSARRCCCPRCTVGLDPQDLVDWMLRDGVPARLNLQLHKYVWAPRHARVY